MSFHYLSLFDLDRTILSVNSSNALVWFAYRKNIIGKKDILKGLYLAFLYRTGLRHTMKILLEMTTWIKGMEFSTLSDIAKQISDNYLIDKIRSGIYEEIEMHRNAGAKIVMLSAALPVLCHAIANHLRIHDVICTEMEVVDGKYTGMALGDICYGEEKLTRLKAYCNEHDFVLKDTYYYADSISDIFVLSEVGYPVCIDPDRLLKRAAIKNGWPVPQWS